MHQAAHFSLTENAMKLSPVLSNSSPAPSGTGGGRGSIGRAGGIEDVAGVDTSRRLRDSMSEVEGSRTGYGPVVGSGTKTEVLLVSCPCMRPFGRRRALFPFAGFCYAVGSAIREALPIWALAGTQAGGLGAASWVVGIVIAAGVLAGESGRAAAMTSYIRRRSAEGEGDVEVRQGVRLRMVVRARFVFVTTLGVFYLLLRLTHSVAVQRPIIWIMMVCVVAMTHISLQLSVSLPVAPGARSVEGHEGASSSDGEGEQAPWIKTRGLLLVGGVLGSVAGPLLLALGLHSGWPSPFDSSLWFLVCICVDLWLSGWTRIPVGQHTRLLNAEDDEEEEGEGEGERGDRATSATAFAQFV